LGWGGRRAVRAPLMALRPLAAVATRRAARVQDGGGVRQQRAARPTTGGAARAGVGARGRRAARRAARHAAGDVTARVWR
jgi:hypothetical protein